MLPPTAYGPLKCHLTAEEGKIAEKYSYTEFWENLRNNWDDIKYFTEHQDNRCLSLIDQCLPDVLKPFLAFEITYNEINSQYLRSHRGLFELYISPKGRIENVPIMKALYHSRIDMPKLIVSCYRSYHINNEMISEIKGDIVVNRSDFAFQSSTGYISVNGKNNPVLNLVIVTKPELLKRQTVEFETGSSREVYMPNPAYNFIDIIFNNVIGEYNLINHIGYIEFLPNDSPQLSSEHMFAEIDEIKKELQVIHACLGIRVCNYCGHNELQNILMTCCKSIYYCSRKCQAADRANHKLICEK